MTWLQLRLQGKREQVELLEDMLLDSGAVAVTLEDNADQPVLEPAPGETPLWQATRLTGLYPADWDMQQVLHTLPADVIANCTPRVEILEDKDWEREWMRHYQPMQFGSRLWICPSWLEPPQPDAVNLMLDPGLAFGTGTHPTTALCLQQLDGMILDGKQVVDYGCGSGILGLAALKLGATQVLGIDNDPQALTATAENALRNQIAPERLPVLAPQDEKLEDWQGSAHVVVANILASPLLELSSELLALLRADGTLLLSGLLQSQTSTLINHYRPQINLVVAATLDDWVCLRGQRSS